MRYILPCPRCQTELRIPIDLGKLTVRCPRCYESFLFDPDNAGKHGDGYFEKDSKEDNPYRKSSLETFWNRFRQNTSDFGRRFRTASAQTFGQTPGKRFARNLLLILLAIGIVRTCFFSPFSDLQNQNPFPDQTTPQESQPQEIIPDEPSTTPPQQETKPKFEI